MSKIQEALEKIKADSNKAGVHDASIRYTTISRHVDSDKRTDAMALANDIAEMYQPELLSPEQKANSKIIDMAMSDRSVFNAFRDIRTTIIKRVKENSPIIMVTSCGQNGGGSFISLNLAVAISMEETKTSLLVDCNLANPNFSYLPVAEKNIVGLTEYFLNDELSVGDIVYPTGVQRLRVIPAGLRNIPVADHFTSVRLHRLFDEIKERYLQRYIIVDAPPIADYADARILAEICDYVILVVPYGKVTDDQVIKAARAIGKEKLLGTVFNNEPHIPRMAWR